MEITFAGVRSTLEEHHAFVVTTHLNPDADAVGSEVALAAFLHRRGKQVSILNPSETPQNLTFLSSVYPIVHFRENEHSGIIVNTEVVIVIDANQPNRIHPLIESMKRSSAFILCIDHHPNPEPFADAYYIDEETAASGEIMYRLIEFIDPAAINRPIAEALYAAIMTDTGSFRFPKTDADIHRIATDLLRRGADPTLIYQKIYEEASLNKLRLVGKALDSLTVIHGGTVATMVLTRLSFQETGASEADTDNIINFALTIGGVRIAILFAELTDEIKVSFRSKGEIPINALAHEFGGNGHKNAAGARIPGGVLEDVVRRVSERSGSYVEVAISTGRQ